MQNIQKPNDVLSQKYTTANNIQLGFTIPLGFEIASNFFITKVIPDVQVFSKFVFACATEPARIEVQNQFRNIQIWDGFGRCWKTKILDFHSFWHIFSIKGGHEIELKSNGKIAALAGGRPPCQDSFAKNLAALCFGYI